MRAFLVGLLPLAAAHTTISVSTPAALREAITDGAHIEVANDMVIDEEFVIPPDYDVEIASTNGATLFATNSASHFRIDGTLRLENLVLTNGSATYSFCTYLDRGGETCGGGALHVDQGAKLVLVNCVIANSTARYGGGLYAYQADVEIHGTTFEGHNIPYMEAGGALFTYEHTSLKIAGSRFVSNSAPKAGAVFLGGDTEIYDTLFIGNKATSTWEWSGDGGAVWINEGDLTISGSSFINNEATSGGPAIHVRAQTSQLTVVSTTFTNNIDLDGSAAVSYVKKTGYDPPVIDCVASCDSLGGGTCTTVDCAGCPSPSWGAPGDACDRSTCTCYSCDCTYPTFPTPQPTGPSPAPTVTRAPTLAPHDASWWRANAGTTDGAAGSALSPFAVLAAILVLINTTVTQSSIATRRWLVRAGSSE